MKWYPIIRILLYLREIESKEKNYEENLVDSDELHNSLRSARQQRHREGRRNVA